MTQLTVFLSSVWRPELNSLLWVPLQPELMWGIWGHGDIKQWIQVLNTSLSHSISLFLSDKFTDKWRNWWGCSTLSDLQSHSYISTLPSQRKFGRQNSPSPRDSTALCPFWNSSGILVAGSFAEGWEWFTMTQVTHKLVWAVIQKLQCSKPWLLVLPVPHLPSA